MKITLKPVIWLKKADKEGRCPIAICITGGGKRTYYNTKIKALPKHYVNGRIVKGETNYDIKNNRLQALLRDADRELLNMELQGQAVTLDSAKAIFDPTAKSGDFVKFYRSYIDNLIATKKKAPATIAIWETEYSKFHEFVKGKISYRQIDTELLNRYHVSIMTYKIKNTTHQTEPTTIHKKLKKIMQIVGLAIKEGHINAKQIAAFEMVKSVEPPTNYLTLEQVNKIWGLVSSGELDHDVELKKTACFFLIECNAGIRFSDWQSFSVETLMDRRNFKVRETQKNKEPVYLSLDVFKSLDRVLEYIQGHRITFDITEQATNRILKDLGRRIGYEHGLTTHVGRHTFGTLLGELGYSTAKIAEAMGISERTAKIYVHQTRRGFRQESERLGAW